MKIVKIGKEHTCSLCFKPIEVGEEALMYFSTQVPRKLKPGHIKIKIGSGLGVIHFRHFVCQYKSRYRNCSLEEFINRLKLEYQGKKKNLKARREKEKAKEQFIKYKVKEGSSKFYKK